MAEAVREKMEISEAEYDYIRKKVYSHSRIDIGEGKQTLVTNRLHRRLEELGLTSYGEYCDGLNNEKELELLIDLIATNHTFFFREKGHFRYLIEEALKEVEGEINIWSAGCSSGEEAYSIAMEMSEHAGGRRWQIVASDISSRIVNVAKEGAYSKEKVRGVPEEYLKKHFREREDGGYEVRPEIKDKVKFHKHNLFDKELPFQCGAFQVIFCRNVMIYFDKLCQEKLVKMLESRLVPGGYLFTGHAESIRHLNRGLAFIESATYRR